MQNTTQTPCGICGKVHGERAKVMNPDALNGTEVDIIIKALHTAANHLIIMGGGDGLNTVGEIRTTVEALGLVRTKLEGIAARGGDLVVIPF